MSKPNIIVHRYAQPVAGYAATVSPEGGGWTLFLPADGGVPDLWVETAASDEHGASVRAMVPACDYPDARHTAEVMNARTKGARQMRARCIEAAQDVGGFDGDAVTAMRIADRIEALSVDEA
jgi:hypothetical protein